jgi:sensor histidine kinase YesM
MDKLVVRNDLRQRMQLAASSKIGLKNLNERCKLILNREVETQETADEFIVKVPLKLNDLGK